MSDSTSSVVLVNIKFCLLLFLTNGWRVLFLKLKNRRRVGLYVFKHGLISRQNVSSVYPDNVLLNKFKNGTK